MAYDDVHEVIEQIFESLLSRYQVGLKTLMRGSHFIFDDLISYIMNVIKSISKVVVDILILRTK